MLKADLHIHTAEDRHHKIKYTAKQVIDYAASEGFEVISITNHNILTYTKELGDYAKKKGILLIPGIEFEIEGKQVLIYGIKESEIKDITKLTELTKLRHALKIAPHPFYHLSVCLGNLVAYNFIDAIEYSFLHTHFINPNKKAEDISVELKKPLVGTSDAHHINQIGKTYSFIDAKKDVSSVINAVKKGKVIVITKPLNIFEFIKFLLNTFMH
jgi:hypothetical protein